MRHIWPLLLIVLGGCFSSNPPFFKTTPPTPTASESIFPHSSTWKSATEHGVFVRNSLQSDPASCMPCHGEALEGGSGPSCYSCHTVYPHTNKGVTTAQHGAAVLKEGKSACATTCHGSDMKGGLSGVACTKCHENYPHLDNWFKPEVHGPMASGNQKFACTTCHGKDWLGGTSGVACVNCHKKVYPHPDQWTKPDQHGSFVMENGTSACATLCHGTQLEGGLSGVNCTGCHNLWPHPKTTWFAEHGEKARSVGVNACIGCHKQDPPGGKTGVNCTSCHESVFAHQSLGWKSSSGADGHGMYVITQKNPLDPKTGCPVCHGAQLEGGKKPSLPQLKQTPACSSCHDYPHPAQWGQTPHGTAVAALIANQPNALQLIHDKCGLCHGAKLEGKPPIKGCYDCHASYPQNHLPITWKTAEGHGVTVMKSIDVNKGDVSGQLSTLLIECRLCHGQELQGGTVQKTCYKCHTSFPHPTPDIATAGGTWKAGHGPYYQAEKKAGAVTCATANCHGADMNGTALVKGCYSCHPADHMTESWAKSVTEDVFGGDHGPWVVKKGAQEAGCLTPCHGSEGKGGTAKACTSCHQDYPHTWKSNDGGFGPVDAGYALHGQAILTNLSTPNKDDDTVDATRLSQCDACHNMDQPSGAWSADVGPYDPKQGKGGIQLPNGEWIYRCMACHKYPHKTIITGSSTYLWKGRHYVLINKWIDLSNPANKLSFITQTCGNAFGNDGCHVHGPFAYGDPVKAAKDECKLCHK